MTSSNSALRGGAAGVGASLKQAQGIPRKSSLAKYAEQFLRRQVEMEEVTPFPDTPAGHVEHAQRMTDSQVALACWLRWCAAVRLLGYFDIALVGIPPVTKAIKEFAAPDLSLEITLLEINQTKPYSFFHLAPPMLPNLRVYFVQNLVIHCLCVFDSVLKVHGDLAPVLR